jgi:hypothetical protein
MSSLIPEGVGRGVEGLRPVRALPQELQGEVKARHGHQPEQAERDAEHHGEADVEDDEEPAVVVIDDEVPDGVAAHRSAR